ncbi:MAG: hypothetical protein AB1916_09370 [Thermodesulfobacteriota bacterium]
MAQAPEGAPRVFLAPGANPAPTLLAGHAPGPGRFELMWEAPTDPDLLPQWAPRVAASLADLGLTAFCLDPASVSRTLGLPVEPALVRFGQAFWPAVDRDCLAYLLVGETGREAVYQAVRAWERSLPDIRFDSSLDLDLREREMPVEAAAASRRGLKGLFPRLFK